MLCTTCPMPATWWESGEPWCIDHAPLAMEKDRVCACGLPMATAVRSGGEIVWEGGTPDHSCPATPEEGGEPDVSDVDASMADTQAALDEWADFLANVKRTPRNVAR